MSNKTRNSFSYLVPTETSLVEQSVYISYCPKQSISYTIGHSSVAPVFMAFGGTTGDYRASITSNYTNSSNLRQWSSSIVTIDTAPSRICLDGYKWILTHSSNSEYFSYNSSDVYVKTGGMSISASLAGIAYDPIGQIYVGVGLGGIFYGYDGLNWYESETGSDILDNGDAPTIGNVMWNGAIWVAVGKGTNHSIAYSHNGIHWSAVTGSKSLFNATGEGIDLTWNGTIWIVVGAGNSSHIATSIDGISWTSV